MKKVTNMTRCEFTLFCLTEIDSQSLGRVERNTGYSAYGPEAKALLDEIQRVHALYDAAEVKPSWEDYK